MQQIIISVIITHYFIPSLNITLSGTAWQGGYNHSNGGVVDLGGVGLVIVESVWGELLDASGDMKGYISEGVRDREGGVEISDKVS